MVDVPYHTHTFDIPTASEGEIRAGIEGGKAITPDHLSPVLADKADKATTLAGYGITDAATQEQGKKADTAIQPSQVSSVGFSGRYDDILNRPYLGNASGLNTGTTAGTVAAGNDSRIVSAVQKSTSVSAGDGLAGGGALAANITLALSSTSLASLSRADTAVQPSALKALAYKDRVTTADIDAVGSDDVDAILTKGGLWVKPTGVGDMLQSVWQPIIDANTTARHTHNNKAILDGTQQSFTTVLKNKLDGLEVGADVTTTAKVGAATAAATSKQTPADSDFFSGVLAGGSTMFKTTWGNIKATLKSYFDGLYLGVGMLVAGRLKVAHIPHMQGNDADGYIRICQSFTGDSNVGGSMNLDTNGNFWYSYDGVRVFRITTEGVMDTGSIPAALVNSGTLAEARIPMLSAGKIPNLDASKVTSGAFADARIPNLNASKVTAGVFSSARIPALNYASLPYTGGTQNELNFPVGHMVALFLTSSESTSVSRNQTVNNPKVASTDGLGYALGGSGSVLSGTWRSRGVLTQSSANSFVLIQRVA